MSRIYNTLNQFLNYYANLPIIKLKEQSTSTKILGYFQENLSINTHEKSILQQTAERFECVTVFFGDIVGFNQLTSDCTALEVDFG